MSSYQQEVFAFISSVIGQKNIIPVPVEFIRFTGDANTAILLTQVIYWIDRTKDPNGWFYKSYAEWEEELALSKYQVNRASGVLKTMNLIETKVKMIYNGDKVLHYQLNQEAFISLFGEHLHKRKELLNSTSKETSLLEVKKLNSLKQRNLTPNHFTKTTLKTTTTEPPAAAAVKKENPKARQQDTDSKAKLDLLITMIPIKHQTPIVIKFIEERLNEGINIEELKACILYVKDKAKGNSSQFKSYIGKCLDNKWASGYLEEFEAEKLKKIEQEAHDAMQAFLIAQERRAKLDAEEEARAKAKADNDEINAILETVDIADLDNWIESKEIWDAVSSFEQRRWKHGERYITRRILIRKYLQQKLLLVT